MAGQVPPAIITSLPVDNETREESASSPMDSHLQQRKVERQQQQHKGLVRPSQLSQMESVPDSPGLQARLETLEDGFDPTSSSSPVGTALLAKKAARPHASSSLADPSLQSGGDEPLPSS